MLKESKDKEKNKVLDKKINKDGEKLKMHS